MTTRENITKKDVLITILCLLSIFFLLPLFLRTWRAAQLRGAYQDLERRLPQLTEKHKNEILNVADLIASTTSSESLVRQARDGVCQDISRDFEKMFDDYTLYSGIGGCMFWKESAGHFILAPGRDPYGHQETIDTAPLFTSTAELPMVFIDEREKGLIHVLTLLKKDPKIVLEFHVLSKRLISKYESEIGP